MTEQKRKTRKKIKKILNNYVTQWDGLDGYQLCVSELEKLTTKVSSVEMPVKPANGGVIAIIDLMIDEKKEESIKLSYKNQFNLLADKNAEIIALMQLKSRLSV